jgi:hypothetical protein
MPYMPYMWPAIAFEVAVSLYAQLFQMSELAHTTLFNTKNILSFSGLCTEWSKHSNKRAVRVARLQFSWSILSLRCFLLRLAKG